VIVSHICCLKFGHLVLQEIMVQALHFPLHPWGGYKHKDCSWQFLHEAQLFRIYGLHVLVLGTLWLYISLEIVV
jgi:hypothetical protein